MLPDVDLWNVLELCIALLMLALTFGVCAMVVGAVSAALRNKDGES